MRIQDKWVEFLRREDELIGEEGRETFPVSQALVQKFVMEEFEQCQKLDELEAHISMHTIGDFLCHICHYVLTNNGYEAKMNVIDDEKPSGPGIILA